MKSIQLAIKCPDCESNDTEFIGDIPKTDVFAGRFMDELLEAGALYRCQNCALGFRWPQMAKNDLNSLYLQGDDEAWSVATAADRIDWQQADSWINTRLSVGSKILDVGCFDGGFLSLLGAKYQRFGIEINRLASLRAEENGINVIATDYEDIGGMYDCITSFDVIEHVRHPEDFLNLCAKSVRHGGYILISTGNMDAYSFKMQGAKYWYSTISEHVSFISPKWLKLKAKKFNLKVEGLVYFSHAESRSVSNICKEVILNIMYWLLPASLGWLRQLGIGQKRFLINRELINHPPSWFTAKDHVMVLMKKL